MEANGRSGFFISIKEVSMKHLKNMGSYSIMALLLSVAMAMFYTPTASAQAEFDSETNQLYIPEILVDNDVCFADVGIQFHPGSEGMAFGEFELIQAGECEYEQPPGFSPPAQPPDTLADNTLGCIGTDEDGNRHNYFEGDPRCDPD